MVFNPRLRDRLHCMGSGGEKAFKKGYGQIDGLERALCLLRRGVGKSIRRGLQRAR